MSSDRGLCACVQVVRFGTDMYDPQTSIGNNLRQYYNTTPGSRDFNAKGTAAHPFRTVNGKHTIVIDAGLVGSRANDVESYLVLSRFFNAQVKTVEVQVRAFSYPDFWFGLERSETKGLG